MLPNFLILGAQKAGTSWLAAHLGQHPDIYLYPHEIHFFDKDYNFARGIGWYETHFSRAGNRAAVGEKTPDYLWANGQGGEGHLPEVHHHIRRYLPEARFLLSLRNPVERAISAANHILRTGRVSPRFSIDDLLIGRQKHLLAGHGVLEYGDYWQQLEAYFSLFREEQFLILIFEEDILQNPHVGLRKACQHVGVDPSFPFTKVEETENAYRYSRPRLFLNYYVPFLRRLTRPVDWFFPVQKARPQRTTLEALYARYAPENEKLEQFLGRKLPVWSSG